MIAALVANSTVAVAKLFAFFITGSAAMLAECIHSVADSSNQGLLLYGSRAARRPADDSHPFGRGKEVYFWSFLVAVMLFFGGGVWAFIHGWEAISHPEPLGDLMASFIVLGLALVVESVSFGVAIREFNRHRGGTPVWRAVRESKDSSLIVILLEDAAAMLGLVFALVGTTLARATGDSRWDGAASLLIGVMLAVVAVLLAAEIKALLIGEAAGRRDRALIRATLLGLDEGNRGTAPPHHASGTGRPAGERGGRLRGGSGRGRDSRGHRQGGAGDQGQHPRGGEHLRGTL